jgi:hypothetical protein
MFYNVQGSGEAQACHHQSSLGNTTPNSHWQAHFAHPCAMKNHTHPNAENEFEIAFTALTFNIQSCIHHF